MKTFNHTPSSFPARYWRGIGGGRVRCELCPRLCQLGEGQRGLCFVRACEGQQMVLTTYGRSSGFCIDPIEKKPLNHFLPGSSVFSFGTAGCNLTCKFCQNWGISKSREVHTLAEQASPQELARATHDAACSSIAFTYNDPVIFLEYAVDTAAACREVGIETVAVTAGYISEQAREEFFGQMTAANVDLKSFREEFYHKMCSAHLQPVLDTLEYIKHSTRLWLEITNLIIPGENDSSAELEEMSGWIAERLGVDVPLHFTAFHPDYRILDKQPTSLKTLRRAREIAKANGLRYVYTGNVADKEGATTFCHKCGNKLIVRDRYIVCRYDLNEGGGCAKCGTPCAGVFRGSPDDWGGKRVGVSL